MRDCVHLPLERSAYEAVICTGRFPGEHAGREPRCSTVSENAALTTVAARTQRMSDFRVGGPDGANKNTGRLVKCEFQINNNTF